jgi:cellulose synthase/poly-beta-1,6-N-acetylglucosamine synthase-like glycosyltransferase
VNLALAASLLLGGCLLGLALRTEARRRRAPPLPPPSPVLRDVTILLPVRNEEQNAIPCVESLLAQTAEPLVLVVDDGSTDATAARVAGRAEGEPRLRLIEAGPLAEGWRGKLHALWVGSRSAESPWLLLTDADTRHHPEALARVRAAAEAGGLDAVSLAGLQEAHGAGENLLIPAVFALLDAILGSWEAAAAGAGPAVANGQLILLRREAWERAGGFPAVRAAPLDDVAIARRLRETGGRTAFFRAPDLLRIRMYRGVREAVQGWRRNLGGIFGDQPRTAALILAVLLAPPAVLATELLTGQWTAAALLWGAGAAASALLRSGSGHAPAWGLLHPCDNLFLAVVLALSLRDRRRGRLVSWKGREMKV